MHLFQTSLLLAIAVILLLDHQSVAFPLTGRAPLARTGTTRDGDATFSLGNLTYLTNLGHPVITLPTPRVEHLGTSDTLIPFTVISINQPSVTGRLLQDIINIYSAGDDVFSSDFLEGIYLLANCSINDSIQLDNSALDFLKTLAPSHVLFDKNFSFPEENILNARIRSLSASHDLPAGPYAASFGPDSVSFSIVYRLYEDSYRDFLYGTYKSNDGTDTFSALDSFSARQWFPYIPVPSRIYSWSDPRPLAGVRVAIKDLFDMKGLITSGGSQAWASITSPANNTAPSIRRLVDLGAVLVGKYKLAQFASGANAWDWQDEHYPWNPRGDGYLTCSASSSGGGCSVAAYDWLDFAIGSDTGSSMRRPGAVSGTFANRPSQGLMSLEGVMPLAAASDTAGVFARDPKAWVHFAKNWYAPDLHQNSSITGLPAMNVSDNHNFAKRILYLTDYLPLANPAAEIILQDFLSNISSIFNMTIENAAFSTLMNTSVPTLSEANAAIDTMGDFTQWHSVGQPLVSTWDSLYGRFPPIDAAKRDSWPFANSSTYNQTAYDTALQTKAAANAWFDTHILFETTESCSESIMVWDIGTGGLPSFREEDLITDNPAAAFLATVPERAAVSGASICPMYGCVDMTVPIGQVKYVSNVTFREEWMPVTVSVIARRGCDFMLWNMWERMAEEGVLRTVRSGRTAFESDEG